MEETYIKKITTIAILAILAILAFFLLKPILISLLMGLLLAFIFLPVYEKLQKWIRFKKLSAILICIFVLAIIIMPFYFLIPVLIDQSVQIYSSSQQINWVSIAETIFPSIISLEGISEGLVSIIPNLISKLINSAIAYFSDLILSFPNILLQLFVTFFTFYFALIGQRKFYSYIQGLLPFSKEIEKKIIHQTKMVTASVIYGQIIIGVIQGITAGAGFFIFGVSNALLLTVIMCIAGILPIIGTAVIWVPVAIFLFVQGNATAAIGVIIFGAFSSIIDNILRPIIVSKRSKIHPAILLTGMIGGLFAFGVVGFILGPLILAYLLILIEIYRGKKIKESLLQPS